MSREGVLIYLAGVATGLLLAWGAYLAKKFDVFGIRPDRIVTYRQVDGHPLALHVFDARKARDGRGTPTLLLFHGGRWQYGSPRGFYRQCDQFASQGLTCVSAEYRIRTTHGTDPRAAIRDARAALAYLHRHAADLGIDPFRIAVGGGSSGGHLAACLGVPLPLTAGDGPSGDLPRPAALLLYNPMIDLSPGMPDHHLVAEFWHDVSPLQHVDSDIPPTLLMLGSEDREIPVATAERFCAAVARHGGRCDLAVYPGAQHGFFNPGVEKGRYFRATTSRVTEFLTDISLTSGR